MEHIRSAIEKARQEREAAKAARKAGSTAPEPAAARPDHEQVARQMAWDALTPFDARYGQLRRNMILTRHANSAATPFDVLRTNILHEMRGHGWRRLAITSPGGGCGKTTLSLNLAYSIARQPEMKVILIELDLRRPAVTRMLGLREKVDLPAALTGAEPVENHIVRLTPNLAAAVSQQPYASPAELLQSTVAAQVIDQIEQAYLPDIMIFDMPPMLVADDTMAFLDQIDAVLLLGAAEMTSTDELGRCKADIESRSNLLGMVLNKCRYLEKTDGYHYGQY